MKALLVALLVPPLNLALYAFVAGVWAARNGRRRWARGVSLGALGLLVVLAMPVAASALIASLSDGLSLTPPADAPPQAIVILSGDLAHSAPPFPVLDVGHLSLERLRAGAALYRRTHLPVLVSGGPFVGSAVTLASLMTQSLAEDFATPVRWQEATSQDTWQNAADSAGILHAQGIRSVYLVTHAMHMRRAIIAFSRFGIVATPAPVRIDAWPLLDPREFIPNTSAWIDSYYGFHEWLGCAYYALR